MKILEAGMQCPDFRETTIDGRNIDLGANPRQKFWLMFYRYASCPLCNFHLATVMQEYAQLKKRGVDVVAIFESEESKFPPKMKQGILSTLPMISNPEKNLYDLYRVGKSLGGVLHPKVLGSLVKAVAAGHPQGVPDGQLTQLTAHFLINPGGIIHTAHYGKTIDDNISWGRVKQFAAHS
ncbi:MAG: redoxin domain-containing protein [Oligoflexia bacterium]|nr:redoxin domain-containing protein [Oligoflexia bacterium]